MTGTTLRIDPDFEGDPQIPEIPPPADYPFEPSPDEYSAEIFDPSYRSRRETYLALIRRNPAPHNPKAPWYELARLSVGGSPHLGIITSAFDHIQDRQDGADAQLHFVLRLLYQFSDQPALELSLLQHAQQVVLEFKYWPDEPGADAMTYWTESHYLLFSAAGYLAGQLYPEMVFTNSGLSGSDLSGLHRERLLQWMNLRFFTGFSEWLSNVYYDEHLTALLNLVQFSQDQEIRQRASMLVDLLLLDISLNQFQGSFSSTHGRGFGDSNKWAELESTTDTSKLLFGKGLFSISDNTSAVAFALSDAYQLPTVLFEIANDQSRNEMLNRQRVGILVNQAGWWGLKARKLADALHLLTLEAYFHPQVVNSFVKMANHYGWWENQLFEPLTRRKGLLKTLHALRLLPLFTRLFEEDLGRTAREQANLYTYRTPDYMLSSAQDFRKGYGGHQQHLWQATLGRGAVCFTTHPARHNGPPPNYWSGSGFLPRVAQLKTCSSPSTASPNRLPSGFRTNCTSPTPGCRVTSSKKSWKKTAGSSPGSVMATWPCSPNTRMNGAPHPGKTRTGRSSWRSPGISGFVRWGARKPAANSKTSSRRSSSPKCVSTIPASPTPPPPRDACSSVGTVPSSVTGVRFPSTATRVTAIPTSRSTSLPMKCPSSWASTTSTSTGSLPPVSPPPSPRNSPSLM